MPVINISYSSAVRPYHDPRALMVLGSQISVDILPPYVVEKWARSSKKEVKSAIKLEALIDTGASVTGVDEAVLNQLGYPPIGVSYLATPSGTSQTRVYMVRLVIPSRSDLRFPANIPRIIIDNVRVISVKLDGQSYKVLLGRDVLSRMVMVYNGPQALITLGY
ncbi:hypothetical protein J7L29_01690 [Candidatus Bathyarchaeota archaeon]|nr:hypothetical protein [Candidatus Bathyarchaeota archaeon]